MELLEIREGRTQLETLAAVAHLQYEKGENPRVKDITAVVPFTKGAVSNNCKKLLAQGLINEDDKRFSLNDKNLLAAYRQHLEPYLVREPASEFFAEDVETKNRIRTRVAENIDEWLEDSRIREVLLEILRQSLLSVRQQVHLQTLREVFLYSDQLISKTYREIEETMWEGKMKGSGGLLREVFDNLAQCIDRGLNYLDKIFQKISEQKKLFEEGKLRSDIKDKLVNFCQKNGIKKMYLFGSVLSEDFSPLSDIDVVVEFQEGKTPGWEFVDLEQQLQNIFERKVDLTTKGGMSSDFRDRVMNEARLLYEAA